MKEEFKLMGLTAVWWLFIIGLIFVVSIVGLWVRPLILDLQNTQNQHTYEYVTSVKESLISSYTEWKQLEAEISTLSDATVISAKRANQAAIVVEMRAKSLRINPDQVPLEIARFLNSK